MAIITYPNFFIVGMERSGTHWVAALLNSHPDIACFPTLPFSVEPGGNKVGEVHFFNTLASLDERHFLFKRPFEDFSTKYNNVFADLVPLRKTMKKEDVYRKFVERFNEYADKQRGDKKIVGESTPAYVFCLDFIDELYPEIKKIAIIRNPKDKIVSWHFNQIRKNRKNEGEPITEAFALAYLVERIIPEYEALLGYEGHVHVLTYERLSSHGVPTVQDMVAYLGIHASTDLCEYMLKNASFETQTQRDSGVKRMKGEQDITSGLRKGVVGDWQTHLSADIAAKVDDATMAVRREVFNKYNVIAE